MVTELCSSGWQGVANNVEYSNCNGRDFVFSPMVEFNVLHGF